MGRTITASSLILCASLAAFGQANESFEVASVKLSTVPPPGAPGTDGGPGTRYPEHYSAFTTLRGYLFRAYGLEDTQQVSGPGWIDSEKYAIEARVAPGTTKEQFQRMLQNLLTERFKLAIHHETIVLPVYNLVVAKNGPKFKESPDTPPTDPVPPSNRNDKDGFPVAPPGQPVLANSLAMGPSGPVSRWRVQQQPIAAFARMLGRSTNVERMTVDKTGLPGKYDFTLSYEIQIQGAPAGGNPTLSVFDALEQQLGLRLVDGKTSLDKIVVDRGERIPTEN